MTMTTIECPTMGALRTHLDLPSPEVESHLDTCTTCRDLMVTVAGDAGTVNRLLKGLTPPPETVPEPAMHSRSRTVHHDVASRRWRGFSPRRAGDAPRLTAGSPPRRTVATAVAAVLAVTVVLTPGGRSAVAQFLDTLRDEQLQVIQFNPDELEDNYLNDEGDLAGLHDLLAEAHVDVPDPVQVTTAEEAQAITGLQPPSAATLREGLDIPGTDTAYVASPGGVVTLTLEARADNEVPDSLDGVVVRIAVPPAVATVLTDQAAMDRTDPGEGARGPLAAGGGRGVLAGSAGILEVTSEGASLEEVRTFLLAQPDLPASLRLQLQGIDDWRNTLPVPLPADDIAWEDVIVNGNEGLAFGDDSGLGAAILWQGDGVVHGVAGTQARSALLDLAGRL
ncbi:hypothetical protein BH24ACT15_BH24ACT15_23230 [soil metagenome]